MTSPHRFAHESDHLAVVRLLELPGLGPRRLLSMMREASPGDLLRRVESGRVPRRYAEFSRAWSATLASDLHRRPDDEIRDRLGDTRVLLVDDPDYPEHLRRDVDPPPALFVRGDVERLRRPGVAVVGTRHATEYGRAAASEIGRRLATADVDVVSGLALGIDAAAHRGALAVRSPVDPLDERGDPAVVRRSGAPVGVVASGLDVVYPRANGGLWRAVADAGVVISEAPPGTPPDRFRFPLRNRIIAALARVVVVVESRASGGSMITVDEALKRGVPVMAVPGATTTRASEGTNRLLRDGAMVATSPDDVLAVLGLASIGADPMMRELRVVPRDFDAAVLSVFAHDPLDLDRIVAACAPMTLGEVALSLGRLESWGWLRHTSGWFERVTITT